MAPSSATATTARRALGVYSDEDIDQPLVHALRTRGFDVLTAAEAGTLGQSDEEQLAFAAAAGRVIVSYNRDDFRLLHEQFRRATCRHAGIVLLPQASPLPRRVLRASMLLDWLVQSGSSADRVVMWNDLQQALHRGFRLPGYGNHDVLVVLG